MNTLERQPDPIKRAAMIAESDRESLIWQEQDKMINAFLSGNMPGITQELMKLKEQLEPVSRFFNNFNAEQEAPKQRISKKERERLELEAYERELDLKAIQKIEGVNTPSI